LVKVGHHESSIGVNEPGRKMLDRRFRTSSSLFLPVFSMVD
jgi:hypothetical protein